MEEQAHPIPHQEVVMLSLAILGSVVLAVGVVRTTALVATDGRHRVPTIKRY